MAATKKEGPLGEIKEELAVIYESKKSDWQIILADISWNGKPPKREIRYVNKHDEKYGLKFGSGISLENDVLHALTEELIRLGYGDSKEIMKEIKAR